MYLIAMAGLPGTGKSTLARALAARLSAHILDKDVVRAALFGPDRIEYSREQDDLVVRALFTAVEHFRDRGRERVVIVDGRTHSKREQVAALADFASSAGITWCIVECACPEAVALERLERDRDLGAHAAKNRSTELYRALAASQDPIEVDKIVIDTSIGTTREHVDQCLAQLRGRGWPLR